jgi:urease accessory protein
MDDLLIFDEHIRAGKIAHVRLHGRLVLRFDQRQKARQRVRLDNGQDVGIQIERGTILRGGDYLRAASGELVYIVAAREPVSIVSSSNPLLLARAAYHLGNRHVNLEVGNNYLRYLRDHVLDHMVESLGFRVMHGNEPFEPEGGAYSHGHGSSDSRGHDPGHDPGSGHSHSHGHGHDRP